MEGDEFIGPWRLQLANLAELVKSLGARLKETEERVAFLENWKNSREDDEYWDRMGEDN